MKQTFLKLRYPIIALTLFAANGTQAAEPAVEPRAEGRVGVAARARARAGAAVDVEDPR